MALDTTALPVLKDSNNWMPVTPPVLKPAAVLAMSPAEYAARRIQLNAESVAGLKNEAGTFAAPPAAVLTSYQLPTFNHTSAAPAITPTTPSEDIWKKTMDYVNQGANSGTQGNRLMLATHLAGQVIGQETNQNNLARTGMVEAGSNARSADEINAANDRKAAEIGAQQDIESQKLHAERAKTEQERAKTEQERWQFIPNIGVTGQATSPTQAMDIRTGTVKDLGGTSSIPEGSKSKNSAGQTLVRTNNAWTLQK